MTPHEVLGFVVYPLWLLAGVADFACHRATDIAHTSGTKESLLHLLQLFLIGLPVLFYLFFDITTLLLAIAAAGVIVHAVVAYWDTAYTHQRREIGPLEQHVHSWLDMLPLVALAIVLLVNSAQVEAALAGGGDWSLRRRQSALPAATLLLVIGSGLLFAVLPALFELRHTLHARRVAKRAQ